MDTKKLRQKILNLAICGKLVPQDPNDEPASVLLERIRAEKERLIKEGKIKRSKKVDSDDEIEASFEIPESWIACKLEDIAYIGTGATPDTRINDYYNGIIPWVSSSCTKNDYIETPTTFITQKAINETNCRIYPKGTLIMAMYGEGKTRGQISELKIDAATNQACAAIVPYNIFTAQYIKLYLKRSYLHIREQAEGGTQPNLNLSKIAQYDIPLPPLNEQQRIANEVKHWFAVIDKLESTEGDLLKAIDQAKSKILDLAIHGKLVPQDPNDEPAIELLKRINPKFNWCNDEQHKNLPQGWCEIYVGDLANYTNGKAFKPSDWEQNGDPIIRIQNLNDATCKYNYTSVIHEEKYRIKKGDLLFAWAASLGVYIWEGDNAWLNQHIFKVEPYAFIEREYCYYLFQYLIADFYNRSHGSGMVHITKNEFEKTLAFLPPKAEQLRIVAKIEELFAVLDDIKESLE